MNTCPGSAWGEEAYLNDVEVRKAIHIPSSLKDWVWRQCAETNGTLNYTRNFNFNIGPIYDNIFKLHPNIYVTWYNGDLDAFLGSQWFIDDMNLTVINKWREWYVYDEKDGQQVGGWTKDWNRGNGLHFATVRGAGHMVPLYKPLAAFKVFQYFLQNKQLD